MELKKSLRNLKQELRESISTDKKHLQSIIDRLVLQLGSLKHDMDSSEGLVDTIHPRGLIELACQAHALTSEIKTKQVLIEYLSRIDCGIPNNRKTAR